MAEIKLPPETLGQLQTARKQLEDVDAFIRKAEIAGIPVEAQKQRSAQLNAQIRKLRDGFFPGEIV